MQEPYSGYLVNLTSALYVDYPLFIIVCTKPIVFIVSCAVCPPQVLLHNPVNAELIYFSFAIADIYLFMSCVHNHLLLLSVNRSSNWTSHFIFQRFQLMHVTAKLSWHNSFRLQCFMVLPRCHEIVKYVIVLCWCNSHNWHTKAWKNVTLEDLILAMMLSQGYL